MTDSVPFVLTQVDGQPCAWIAGDNTLHVVGESYYQEHLQRVAQVVGTHKPFAVWLVPEPYNPNDPSAVAVFAGAGKIGHLARQDAEPWQWAIIELERIAGARAACAATLFETESTAPWAKGGSLVEAYLTLPFPPRRPPLSPKVHDLLAGAPCGLLSIAQVNLDATCPTCGAVVRIDLQQIETIKTLPCDHPFAYDPADLLMIAEQLRRLSSATKAKTTPKPRMGVRRKRK